VRQRPRVDANQAEIVAALRAIGATVTITAAIGHGFPDLAVGYHGVTTLLEVKAPGGRITADEAAWFEGWHGDAYIVSSCQEAIQVVQDLAAVRPASIVRAMQWGRTNRVTPEVRE
jgi:hypothetical protein